MVLVSILFFSLLPWGASATEVKVPRSMYAPAFRDPGEADAPVGPLWVDEAPVTNRDFLNFIKGNKTYSKSKIPAVFADEGYLSHWRNETSFETSYSSHPVTNVSWFAARKYCESQGKRLPSIAEWEVLSDAQNPEQEKKILDWYSSPKTQMRAVSKADANRYGVRGTHGVIWEWVENFSESIMSGDSRGGSSTESLFCGGAALKAKDPKLYATFIRFAFRSGLSAQYTSKNLGFRCVRDFGKESQ